MLVLAWTLWVGLASASSLCDDLPAMSRRALAGLDDTERACLEAMLASSSSSATREYVSGVLLADAWTRQDLAAWEALATRHLTDIDAEDAEVAWKLAFQLAKQNPARALDVVRWCDVVVTHDRDARRRVAAWKLRTEAATSLWRAAGDAERDEFERLAIASAKGWAQAARDGGLLPDEAIAACGVVSGDRKACR